MHRELSHADQAFRQESNLPLYLMTGLLGLILAADLWPPIAGWLRDLGLVLPAWPRTISGYRIALLAAILGGARVLYSSLEGLLEGRFGADLAVAIACVAAILINEPLVAAEIVFIGMVGECLESYTFDRTRRAVQKIMEVCPRRCWVLRDGLEVRVLAEEVQVGEQVVVKPGARIPVDGVVLQGQSAVDESALTGESVPVEKVPNSPVLAGSLNQLGALTIEAQRVAEHTVVGRVIELTARALKDKATVERTADRLARYFLPVVLGLALVTFLASLGLHRLGRPGGQGLSWAELARSVYPALSVLVVACPCALILATPAAIIAAMGRLAGTGVLIKGGAALERLAQSRAFAFDKTGTLTEGRLELADVVPFGNCTEEELLRLAATAEQRSEHVLAQVIQKAAADRGLTVTRISEFEAVPGLGVLAEAEQGRLIVGTRRLLEQQGISVPDSAQTILDRLSAKGQTVLLVAHGSTLLGIIGARDRLRPEAAQAISELRRNGIEQIVLLTGDRSAVARQIAEQVGITDVQAELLPEDKAKAIEQLQASMPVAMVGDGINDAPALACAHVGLAIGTGGTDVAAEAGEIVLMGDPLKPLPHLLRLSRETVRIIHQNIVFFAYGVNIVGIVLTAWLWPLLAPSQAWYEQSPLAAVIYHQLGSLAVLLNSMRLLWFEREPSRSMSMVRERLSQVDRWVEQATDFHEALHWLETRWARVVTMGTSLAMLLYAASGLTRIQADEQAVVCRFGRPNADLGPGLHYRWPWPIEQVYRVQLDRSRSLEVGLRPLGTDGSPLAWSSLHGSGRDSEEGVMITGDGDLVELRAAISYRVGDPRAFLFSTRDTQATLRALLEAALRESIAAASFPMLLTTGRSSFQDQTLKRLRELCERCGGLGIHVESLSLQDLHPPLEVVPAYHDVTRAMEAKERTVNEAEGEAVRRRAAAKAEARQTELQAQAQAKEITSQSEAARDAFLTRSKPREELQPDARGLMDFRLFWDSLDKALVGRDKVIIDADKVPGRRHFLFLDPDQFRTPLPSLMLPDRAGPNRSNRTEPPQAPTFDR